MGQDLRAMSARGEILFSGDKFAPAGEGINPRKEIDVGAMMSGWAMMRGTDAFRIWPNSRAGLLPTRSPSPSIESSLSLSQSHSSLAPITLSFSNNLFIILSELDSILTCQGGRQMCSPLVACMLQFGIAV